MREKVLLRVSLPATRHTYEFWVPYDLDVGMAARLMARLLALRESGRFVPGEESRLMLLEGVGTGSLLGQACGIRELVRKGVLTNGSAVALV